MSIHFYISYKASGQSFFRHYGSQGSQLRHDNCNIRKIVIADRDRTKNGRKQMENRAVPRKGTSVIFHCVGKQVEAHLATRCPI